MADRSFRSGLQAGAWTAIASLPLTYALWLSDGLRIYPITGELVFAVDPGPVGVNLADAVFWCLVFAPVVGIPCAVFGAAVAAYRPAGLIRLSPTARPPTLSPIHDGLSTASQG